jgi:FdhE protein
LGEERRRCTGTRSSKGFRSSTLDGVGGLDSGLFRKFPKQALSFQGWLLNRLRERIQAIKKARPAYEKIVEFYGQIREQQERTKVFLENQTIHLSQNRKDLSGGQGSPLVTNKDFPLDLEACLALFDSLCRIAERANPFLAEQVQKIEGAIQKRVFDLHHLLNQGVEEREIEESAKRFGIDPRALLFLLRKCAEPSIEVGMRRFSEEVDPDWREAICPICGSLPFLAVLGEEAGKRLFVCSFCGYPWRTERLFCPYCENKDQHLLHYFYAEEDQTCRVDLCEKCLCYIKTIVQKNATLPDFWLEDVATLHLDLIAVQKGFRRPVPQVWAM